MRKKMKLGKFLSSRRALMGLTQEELALKIGVSKSAIAKWETNGGLPDRDNLRKISEVMNVSLDELHRIIKSDDYPDIDFDINITPEVISVLESYGYKIIRPDEERGGN